MPKTSCPMENALTNAFNRLELSTGDPDPQARKAALVSLVKGGHLNVNEFRLLKELLSPVLLQKDILPNLPVELVLLITDFLREEDVLSCLTVSRAWNTTLMSDRVVFSLADRLFPQLIWKASPNNTTDEETRAELPTHFLRSLKKRLGLIIRSDPSAPRKFDKGYLWDSETEFKLVGQEYSQFPLPNLPVNQNTLYAHGRIAWQRETHTLIIDNLRNRTRRIISFDGGKLLGPEMKLVALGDKLVVATMDRHLLAWDIDTGEFERKTMPAAATRCTTFGRRVTAIADTDIYIWRFGSSLLGMCLPDTDVPILANNQFPKAFVHPHLENVVFARQVYRNSSYTLRFLVHKFVNNKHVKTFVDDVGMSWLGNERFSSSMAGFMPLCHDLNGGFILYEFDMYHEKFSRRDISHIGRPHHDTFMFVIDDDFVVSLGERFYLVW